ncbi:MAG: MFS transporter [Actinomycetota bacterium]
MSEPASAMSARQSRRVAFATLIGTTIELYDFFIYATIASLVFSQVFFAPAGAGVAQLLSFATIGISFVFRPLGAFLSGQVGDRVGRRTMLVATLVLMGGATTAIGLLPTFETAGVLAPVLLLLLRILQGIAAGGEWGGAVLMAVEHAPRGWRGRAGAFPQLGSPLGMILASGVTALMTGVISPGQAFLDWGWRIPFLFSVVLIVIGFVVRLSVDESPVFTEMAAKRARSRTPVVELFRRHWALVLLAALIMAGNNAGGYVTMGGFLSAYTTDPDGPFGLDRTSVLLAITGAAVVWAFTTYAAGVLADRIGRRRINLIGYGCLILAVFPMVALVSTGSVWLLFLGVSLFTFGSGLAFGGQAAWYTELFPASVRYSGVAISFAIGSIMGGAFAPLIASAVLQSSGTLYAVAFYLLGMFVLGTIACVLLRDRPDIDLGPDNQAEQERGATVFDRQAPQHAETSVPR